MGASADDQSEFLSRTLPHQAALRQVVRAYARDAADRDDLLQEIWLQLWRSYPSFRSDSSYLSFLYRVALNTAISRLRRSRRRVAVVSGRDLDGFPSAEMSKASSESEALHKAIHKLNALDRALVILALEERSYADIAEVLGISVKATSVRLVRAKARLKSLIAEYQGSGSGHPAGDHEHGRS